MDFETYDKAVEETAIYPASGEFQGLLYAVIAMCGETGEVANKIKKVMRDHGNIVTVEMRVALADELGDVLWYVSRVAAELGLSLDVVAQRNVDKLQDRMRRNQIQGNGDNR